MRLRNFTPVVVITVFAAPFAYANNYDELKAAALQRCSAIDPAAYQTGLLFNPDGYRSYYLRSQCMQQAAVEFRDEWWLRDDVFGADFILPGENQGALEGVSLPRRVLENRASAADLAIMAGDVFGAA